MGIGAVPKADVAVGVGEGAGTSGWRAAGQWSGVIRGQIEDIAAIAGGEVGDGVGEIALGLVEPAEGVGTIATCEDTPAPPMSVSLPVPAERESAPAPPVRESSPEPEERESEPSPPSRSCRHHRH